MSEIGLDWSSARVRDGKLEIELRGKPDSAWRDSFSRTLALLHNGDWGKIKLGKRRLRVLRVEEGSEERLHHFLESVVTQANAANQPREEAKDVASEPSGVDAEMTRRFRAFADTPPQ